MGFSPEQIKEGAKHGTQSSQVADWILTNSVKQPQQEVQQPAPPEDIPGLTSAIGDSIADATRTATLLDALNTMLGPRGSPNTERTAFAQAGGIEVLTRAFRIHLASSTVVEVLCKVVFNLTRDAENRGRIAAAGGNDRVVQAMAAHVGVAGVQEQGCVALWNLAANNAENKNRIAAAGGIDRVVQAMAAHVGVAEVQKRGCGALWKLADNNAENQERIAAAGGIDRVVQAMAAHVGVEGVQEQGCEALWNLAENAENQERIAAAGAASTGWCRRRRTTPASLGLPTEHCAP
jgi:predicted hotdog family 3-hydroxylacyl-ACP dehydratase